MSLRSKTLGVLLAVLATGGRGLADGPPGEPRAQPAEHVPPAANRELGVPMRRTAPISVEETTRLAGDFMQKIRETAGQMSRLEELARRDKDVIKLNCVNDKRLQLEQVQKIADRARLNLQDAIARADDDARYHELGRVGIASQQAQVFAVEAENCVGEDLGFLGPTTVLVEEPRLADDLMTPGPDLPPVEPPPVASPQA